VPVQPIGVAEYLIAAPLLAPKLILAYQTASAADPILTAAATSGATYTGLTVGKALWSTISDGQNFSTSFNQDFSWWGLGGAMLTGGGAGAYKTFMFNAAEIPPNWFSTPGGFVINGLGSLIGWSTDQAMQGAVNESKNK
jgi:hypothetical protein